MPSWMLDTNIVSYLMRGHPGVIRHLRQVAVGDVSISAITEGELLYGLAKRPSSKRSRAVRELLARLEVLPWSSDVAVRYGPLRAQLEAAGTPLAPLDMQIAAHALAVGCTLVTADQAFPRIEGLSVVDWTQ